MLAPKRQHQVFLISLLRCGAEVEVGGVGLEYVRNQTSKTETDSLLQFILDVWLMTEMCYISFNWVWTCLIRPLWLSVSLYLEISKGDEISTEWLIKEPSIVCVKKWNESLVEIPKEIRRVLWRPCTLALVYKEMWDTGFPGGTSGKEPTCQCRRCKRHGFDPWVGKILWKRSWQPTPVFLPKEFHGPRSLASYTVHGIPKSWTWLKPLSMHVALITFSVVHYSFSKVFHLFKQKFYVH